METQAETKPSSRPKGIAPKIRRMKERNPELTDSEIARRVGCRPSNVSGVLKTYLGRTSIEQLRQFQESKADIYDALQHRLLGSITPSKLAKTNAVSAITGAAILEDKARLVRGQATSINATLLLDAVEALRIRSLSTTTIEAKSIQGVSIEPASE